MNWNAVFALLLAMPLLSPLASAEDGSANSADSMGSLQELNQAPDESQLRRVLKDYHNAALEEFRIAYGNWLQHRGDLQNVTINVDRIYDTRAELASAKTSHVDLLQEKLKLAIQLEAQAAKMEFRQPSRREMPQAKFRDFLRMQVQAAADYRAQTEFELHRAKSPGETRHDLALAPLFLELNSTAQR